ncbi:MAG: hypothetical protein VYC34_03025, partial [Planctomycetota bacterium]|nr:hypothetical protein [Planctomycetota bacterium]
MPIKHRLAGMARTVNEIGQRVGVNITPHHFYSEIPDYRHLKSSDYWRKPWSMVGVDGADVDAQLRFLEPICRPYRDRLAEIDVHKIGCERNGEAGYGNAEAMTLYCMMRSLKPPRVVQVGCGVSTAVI